MGQENRKANWVKLRSFAALNLVKTAERLAVIVRWIRMALQTFAGSAQGKIEGGAAEIQDSEQRQKQG